jgi:hypothetical protein
MPGLGPTVLTDRLLIFTETASAAAEPGTV